MPQLTPALKRELRIHASDAGYGVCLHRHAFSTIFLRETVFFEYCSKTNPQRFLLVTPNTLAPWGASKRIEFNAHELQPPTISSMAQQRTDEGITCQASWFVGC